MNFGLVSVAVVGTLALSTAAFAQGSAPPVPSTKPAAAAAARATTTTTSEYVEQQTDGSQVVTFGGDPLEGDPNSVYGFTIRRPPPILRAGLIRPRVNFVSELLKSVENL